MKNTGAMVSAAKVRRIVGIAHEAAAIEDPGQRIKQALGGLCDLVGADAGAYLVFNSPDASVPQAGFTYGCTPTMEHYALNAMATRGDGFDLMAQGLRRSFDGSQPVLALRRQALVDNRTWYNSDYLNEFRRGWGVDNCIYSMSFVGNACHGMSVNRSFGSSAFRAEDQTLIEIFHLASARLVAESSRRNPLLNRDAHRASLAPRVRDTLDCLLRGASEKAAAAELRLSPNTVHHYTKIIFSRFGVRSRSELLAKWFATL